LKDAQATLASVNRDMLQLSDVKIPAQIKEAASLQAVKVLRGDYDLKISRQDYFTSNQDQVMLFCPCRMFCNFVKT
jgi:HAUS augmin-like complex subunit 3